jgi:thioredoxin 1
MGHDLVELDDRTFDAQIATGTVLVDFWAPWCGPCRMQTPILERVAARVGQRAVIAKVNVDDSPNVAARFGVMSIPTLIVFKNGAPVQQFVGVQNEETLVQSLTTD